MEDEITIVPPIRIVGQSGQDRWWRQGVAGRLAQWMMPPNLSAAPGHTVCFSRVEYTLAKAATQAYDAQTSAAETADSASQIACP
jgi:hypothetical protein